MTTALKLRRGTTAQHSTFTGGEGEVTVDTTKDTVVVHDGSTAGGFPLLKEANPSYTGTLTGGTGVVNLGSGQLYKAADGKVGIGTASPAQKLQIGVGGSNDYLQFGATNEGFVVGRENASGQFISNATQASPYNVWRWQQGGTDRLVINASGTLELTSGQLKFPATQSVSSDANTLDDYEEGTWAPRVADAASGGTSNTSNSAGWYTKIGNQVTVYGRFDPVITTGMTAGNQLWIRDLPFATANLMAVNAGSVAVAAFTFAGSSPTTYLGNGATGFRLFSGVSGGNGSILLVSSVSSGNSWIYFSVTYQV